MRHQAEAHQQAERISEQEREALRSQLDVYSAQRAADKEEVARLGRSGVALLIARRDAEIQRVREDLRLEGELVAALRMQVEAAEHLKAVEVRARKSKGNQIPSEYL